uniref:hypothetical protein n=1 Tax=Coprococcus sp. TaxID=2049024 RepID=UPI00402840F6
MNYCIASASVCKWLSLGKIKGKYRYIAGRWSGNLPMILQFGIKVVLDGLGIL